jgi:MFS family permease
MQREPADAGVTGEVSTSIRETVVAAYYPRAIAAADSARNRAQAGYAIASAIASALVLAGAFTEIEDRGWPAQLLGGVALISWVVAGILFLRAVGAPVVARITGSDVDDERDSAKWVASVLQRAQEERDTIDARNARAIKATVVAVFLTLPAIGVTALSAIALDKDQVTVSLSPAAVETLAQVCGRPSDELRGALENRTLRRDFVVITVAPGDCRDDTEVVVRIPKRDVLAIASR